MFEEILKQIKSHNRIIIHRHTNPDGDALGSQIGLKHIIKSNFPDKEVYAVGDSSKRYSFMEDSAGDVIPDEFYVGALAIILDVSSKALISDRRYAEAETTARIDHHIFVEKIADYEVTDTTYESCAGLIAAFAIESGLTIPELAASSLYTGMVTDSGRFRYDSTSARTFRLAAALMEIAPDISDIYRNLYSDEFENVKLRAAYVLKIKQVENGVAYIYTTNAELRKLAIEPFAVSRGMVGVMADIKGIDIWVNFTEATGGILAELRSSKYNINPIAVKYGGGGHAKASGATLSSFNEAMDMISDREKLAELTKGPTV